MSTASPRPRLLRVVTLASRTGRYGGPTDTAVRQAELVQDALDVRVLAGALVGDAPEHELVETVRVRPWVPGMGYSGLFSIALARRLWSQTRRADAVHISLARDAVPVWALLCALTSRRTRTIVQPHGMLTSRTSRLHRLLDLVVVRPLARRADEIIALTETELEELQTWFGRGRRPRPRVVGNPSPAIQAHPAEGAPVAFFAARLHPRKRVGDFVEAARLSLAAGSDCRYVVAGPDQGDGELVRTAAAEAENLTYLGALTPQGVEEELSRAAVFVLPSWNEPWGNVVASAVKARIPVVVTESAALAGELREMGAAYVVPDAEPAELQRAVEEAARIGPDGWRSDGPAVDARFGNEGIRADLLGSYGAVLGQAAPRGRRAVAEGATG